MLRFLAPMTQLYSKLERLLSQRSYVELGWKRRFPIRLQAGPLRLGKPWISLDSGSRVSRCANMQAGRCPRPNMFSVFAGNPIENLRRCHRFLRRMGIQGPGNRAPALLDHLLGKLLRFGFRLEFSGCTNASTLLIALGRDVGTVGNVPDIRLCQAPTIEHAHGLPRDATIIGATPSLHWQAYPSDHLALFP